MTRRTRLRSLVLAGLVADGDPLVSGGLPTSTGFPDLVGDLAALAAVVVREPDALDEI